MTSDEQHCDGVQTTILFYFDILTHSTRNNSIKFNVKQAHDAALAAILANKAIRTVTWLNFAVVILTQLQLGLWVTTYKADRHSNRMIVSVQPAATK